MNEIRFGIAGLCVALGSGLGGCERIVRNMYDQPKLKEATSTPLFANGESSRPPPPGSVARSVGVVSANSSGRRGDTIVTALDAADREQTLPTTIPAAMLARGRERYAIYCAICHGPLGGGDGKVPKHGFPAPPSYHLTRLREAPDRHFFDVMSNGYGIMYSYAGRVNASDRWAIVAWIRHLQTSLGAPLATADVVSATRTPAAIAAHAADAANEQAATGLPKPATVNREGSP